MVYMDGEAEGRALAYLGSVLFSLGLLLFSALVFAWRELLRSAKERRSANWPTAWGRITTCDVKAFHGRFGDHALGILGYSYQIEGSYYSGYLVRQFWGEQQAWTFVDAWRDKSVLIHFKLTNPQFSVLREAEQLSAVCVNQRNLRPAAPFGPGVAILWALRNVSDWAEAKLNREARDWPSASAIVDYAEPKILDDDAHWCGDLHYVYSVGGVPYSNSYYFRANGEEDAREQVEPWRNREIIVRYYQRNPARSVFVLEEQDQPAAKIDSL